MIRVQAAKKLYGRSIEPVASESRPDGRHLPTHLRLNASPTSDVMCAVVL